MDIAYLKKKNLPDTPGVYLFKLGKEILYIGKATSLRDRVRSYFSNEVIKTRGPLIVDMVTKADNLDFKQTDSVLEALVLEAYLIKKHLPVANTKEKDNKSFNYVIITKEDFPQILVERGRTLEMTFPKNKIKYLFGPFPQGGALTEALKIVRRIFPYRDHKCTPAEDQLKADREPRPCFNRQIGLCPGVCTSEISKKEYAKVIQHIKYFFEGKKKDLVKQLTKEMNVLASEHEFEKAAVLRKQLFALGHIHDVSLIKDERIDQSKKAEFRIEAYDIAHISGTNVVGVMTVVEDGQVKKSDYRKFNIKKQANNDVGALKEVLSRRLNHPEWPMPDLIAIDGGIGQLNGAKEILKNRGIEILIVGVVKDNRHKPIDFVGNREIAKKYSKEILIANSEAHRFAITFHRKKRSKFIP